ncbi:HEAT repeat domain-containing protein [bacterium]|nr:MAG: HEAT repeat domain-containing protein [bacterium]
MPLVPLAALLIFLPQGATPLRFPKEYTLQYEYASLLLSGEKGVRELVRRLESKDLTERSYAASTLLDSGDRRFLPRIIGLWSDPELVYLSDHAITRDMDVAWEIILEKARAGDPRAVDRLYWYGSREWLTEELSRSPHGAIRAEILKRQYAPALEKALSDPDQRVIDVAVGGLYNYYQNTRKPLERLFFHKNPQVRAAAVRTTDRRPPYPVAWQIRLADDPDVRVREGALLQLGRLGILEKGKYPIRDGLRAVERALDRRSPRDHAAAVWAIRGWTDVWKSLPTLWTEEEVMIARRLLRRRDVRDALYEESLKRIETYGILHQKIVSTPPAVRSLALSGDPRLFVAMTQLVRQQRTLIGTSWFLEIFSGVPVQKSWGYLMDQAESLIRKPLPPNPYSDGVGDDDPRLVLLAAMSALRPDADMSRILRLLPDRKRSYGERIAIVRGLATFASDAILATIEKLSNDETETLDFREDAVVALRGSRNQDVRAALRRMAKEAKEPRIRNAAERTLVDVGSVR